MHRAEWGHQPMNRSITSDSLQYLYRPQSRGDNTFGSVPPSIYLSVCLSVNAHRVFISRDVQNSCVCNLLLFRQVGCLHSITLLILNASDLQPTVLKERAARLVCLLVMHRWGPHNISQYVWNSHRIKMQIWMTVRLVENSTSLVIKSRQTSFKRL